MIFPLAVLLSLLGATPAAAAGFDTSPNNWANAPGNWENSSANWKNSPANWANSTANSRATNGIHDEDGRRTGYAVRNRDSTVNLFDENGNRTGYIPARKPGRATPPPSGAW
ncbi:MAG: hypothetical protein AB7O49_11365 [Sphingomonadales bacterium]